MLERQEGRKIKTQESEYSLRSTKAIVPFCCSTGNRLLLPSAVLLQVLSEVDEQFTCPHLQSMFFLKIKIPSGRIRLRFIFRNYRRRGRYFSLFTWFSWRCKQLQDLWKVPLWSPAPPSSFFTNWRLQPDH